ncbi:MAG: hypothetical protein ACRYHA_01365 [Janthinobacterium lividum]
MTDGRPALLENFSNAFFRVDGKPLASEAQRVYARHIAAFASPKSTLERTGASPVPISARISSRSRFPRRGAR